MTNIKILGLDRASLKTIASVFPEVANASYPTNKQSQRAVSRFQRRAAGAEAELIDSHILFVASVAIQHLNKGLTPDQLLDAGKEGLIHAGEKFRGFNKFSFTSYAMWWIHQNILENIHLRKQH